MFFTRRHEPLLKIPEAIARQKMMEAACHALFIETNTDFKRPFAYLLPPTYRPVPIPWKLPSQ